MSDRTQPKNVLFAWYERYIGEPRDESDVYLGFGLFFAGIAIAICAFVLFVLGAGLYGLRTENYFVLAQPAYVFGMVSVPLTLLGIVVLLPTERRMQVGAGAGMAIILLAAVGFVISYPDQWFEFGTRNTLVVVGTYAVGITVVIGATGAALVAHQLERVRAPTPSEIEALEEDESEETVSEEQVRRDIEEAMANVELTWGGVDKEEHRRLEFTTDYADEAVDELNVEAKRTVSAGGGVDAQVQGLKQLKGEGTKTARSTETVSDQTAALNELKEQRRRDEIPENAPLAERGLLSRLLSRLGWG